MEVSIKKVAKRVPSEIGIEIIWRQRVFVNLLINGRKSKEEGQCVKWDWHETHRNTGEGKTELLLDGSFHSILDQGLACSVLETWQPHLSCTTCFDHINFGSSNPHADQKDGN